MFLQTKKNELADARGTLIPEQFRPLPDLGFDFIPHVAGTVWVSDLLLKLLFAVTFLRVFMSQHRKRLACAFIEIHTCLMLLRSLTVPLTTFPASQPLCSYKLATKPEHFLIEPLKRMMQPDGMSSWCHDFLFSGHTIVFTIGGLFLNDSRGTLWWRAIGWFLSAAGVITLIMARYTYNSLRASI